MRACKKCASPYYALGLCKKHYTLKRNSEWRAANREEHMARRRNVCRTSGAKFAHLKCHAKARGIAVSISLEEFINTNALPCIYCGESLPETGHGLDRKDNDLSYTFQNSVPCCTRCNTMKGALITYDEMLMIWAQRKITCQQDRTS